MCFRGVKSGNEQFCQDVAAWVFQESLVLRIDSSTHHRVNETDTPEKYTTNDQIVSPTFISLSSSYIYSSSSHLQSHSPRPIASLLFAISAYAHRVGLASTTPIIYCIIFIPFFLFLFSCLVILFRQIANFIVAICILVEDLCSINIPCSQVSIQSVPFIYTKVGLAGHIY